MIEVLRLGHRIRRDPRVSTHVALTARALGASKVYYSGEKDLGLEESINKVTKSFGGKFKIEYVKNPLKLIKNKKIVHLTVYGSSIDKKIKEIRKFKDILVVIGGSKVPGEYYKLSTWNISVTNQPHSEISSLAIFLDRYFKGKKLDIKFNGAKIVINPNERGKTVNRKTFKS